MNVIYIHIYLVFFVFFFPFWPHRVGIEPVCPALGAGSFNHWTPGEVPTVNMLVCFGRHSLLWGMYPEVEFLAHRTGTYLTLIDTDTVFQSGYIT